MRCLILCFGFLLCHYHAALADEVPCADISIQLPVPEFNQRCENRQSKGQASSRVQILDASSPDNTKFLYAYSIIARSGFYFMAPDFKEAVLDDFSSLKVEDWKKGRDIDDFKVAEFSGTVSGIESRCLAFQGRTIRSPGGGGYSRYSIGVTCTAEKDDWDGLYSLLQQLDM